MEVCRSRRRGTLTCTSQLLKSVLQIRSFTSEFWYYSSKRSSGIASFPGSTARHFFALWKNTDSGALPVFFQSAKNAGQWSLGTRLAVAEESQLQAVATLKQFLMTSQRVLHFSGSYIPSQSLMRWHYN